MKNIIPKNQDYLWNSSTLPYLIPLVIGIVFAFLVIAIPVNTERSLLVRLTITIPEIIIWLIASVGAFRFKKYATSIKNYPDGKGLDKIANALLLLVLYIILLTTASTIVNLLAHTEYLDITIALKNHLPVITILASALFLLRGSEDLNEVVGDDIWTKPRLLLLVGSALVFFMVFGYVFYTAQPNLMTTNGMPRFALPVQVLLVTYILPHVIVWFMGLKAAVNLINYTSQVRGVVYKSLFKDLYRGVLLTFICIFTAQFIIITSMVATQPNFALGLIYGVLILALVGFALILRGARKLDKIEQAM
jgi:hypothetical protein